MRHKSSKNKDHMFWLWVVGWMFIFPLPLTILLLRHKKIDFALKYGLIIFSWLIYFPFMIFICNRDFKVLSSTLEHLTGTQKSMQTHVQQEPVDTTNTVATPIEYDDLQSLFLVSTPSMTMEDIESAIQRNNLEYTRQPYNGSPKKICYKIAYEKDVAYQNHAKSGDYLTICFNSEDGTLLYAEYFNNSTFCEALLYNYGIYWDFMEKEPNNVYSGYYYHNPVSDRDGIIIEYDNGKSTQSSYHPCYDSFDALKCVLSSQ